jgi:hypothetical protein
MDQVWYQDFVSDEAMDRDMLFDMLTAANFMGIKPLLDLTCLKVTFQLTGKNAEEVRVIRVSSLPNLYNQGLIILLSLFRSEKFLDFQSSLLRKKLKLGKNTSGFSKNPKLI